jgi:hypothetical protein
MRFVETLKPLVTLALPAAVVAALSGCASMPDPMAVVRQVTGSDSKPAEPEAAKPEQPTSAERAANAEKAGVPPKRAEPEVPVDPRAQGAFDTARRAMRAGRNDEAERQLKALAQSNPELGGVHANLDCCTGRPASCRVGSARRPQAELPTRRCSTTSWYHLPPAGADSPRRATSTTSDRARLPPMHRLCSTSAS